MRTIYVAQGTENDTYLCPGNQTQNFKVENQGSLATLEHDRVKEFPHQ